MKCPVCNSISFESLGWGIPEPHLICKSCGLICNPVPYDKKKYKKEYRESEISMELYDADQKYFQKSRFEFLMQNLPKTPKRRKILDIGCSTGQLIDFFKNSGWHATGIEPTERFAELGRQRGLNIISGFFPQKQIKEHFDLVTMTHVFEHFNNPNYNLEQVHKILAPGGYIFIEVPDARFLQDEDGLQTLCAEHCFTYNDNTLTWILEKNGFSPIKALDTKKERFINLRILAKKSTPKKIQIKDGNYQELREILDNYKKKHSKFSKRVYKASRQTAISIGIRVLGRKRLRKFKSIIIQKEE